MQRLMAGGVFPLVRVNFPIAVLVELGFQITVQGLVVDDDPCDNLRSPFDNNCRRIVMNKPTKA